MTKTRAKITDAGKITHTATWGTTRAEALRHIREVVAVVVAEFIEDGEAHPDDEAGSAGTLVSVTLRTPAHVAPPFDPLVPNAETVVAMNAARRGELVTVGGVEDLIADLHA